MQSFIACYAQLSFATIDLLAPVCCEQVYTRRFNCPRCSCLGQATERQDTLCHTQTLCWPSSWQGGCDGCATAAKQSAAEFLFCDWSDYHSVANGLEYFLDVTERRRGRQRLAPFRVERLDYRNQDQEAFYAGLARNGPKAVEEFRQAFP